MKFQKRLAARIRNTRIGNFLATRIRHKLVAGMLAVSLIPLLALGVAVYFASASALKSQALNNLDAVRSAKSAQLSEHFDNLRNQLRTFSESRMVVDAIQEFRRALPRVQQENGWTVEDLTAFQKEPGTSEAATEQSNSKPGFTADSEQSSAGNQENIAESKSARPARLSPDEIALRHLYITANPEPLDNKQMFDGATDASTYTARHKVYHPVFRSFAERCGFRDVCLIDPQSLKVIYCVSKEQHFATSLSDGRFADSGLAEAVRVAASADKPDTIAFADFSRFAPSSGQPVSFFAAPVFEGDEKIGIAAFAVPIDSLNRILAQRDGLGESGETWLLGSDQLFRTESRFLNELNTESTVLNPNIRVETHAATSALSGEKGTRIVSDYRGKDVLSSWSPFVVHAHDTAEEGAAAQQQSEVVWALVSQMDWDEVRQPVDTMLKVCLIVGSGSAALILLVSLMFAGGMTKQTDAIMETLQKIETGDYDARTAVLTDDELGTVARSLNRMADNTLSLIQSREERDTIQTDIQVLMEEVSDIAMGNLTIEADIERPITGSIADSINFMIQQLREVVRNVKRSTLQVTTSAHQIRTTTEHLSRGSEAQAAQIIDTSAAIDEMSVSIMHVAKNTDDSAKIARQARENAVTGAVAVRDTIQGMERIRHRVQDSAKRIKRLGESSQEIGEIVQMISEIADRTSILALNASIQAAMAGDAGQGFAVVAEEVERLAERSNDSTRQIAALIKAIQMETADAIAAMEESTREVVGGSELAVEAGRALQEIEQVSGNLDELIQDISMSTKQQAHGAEALAKSMNEIANVTQETAHGTKEAARSVTQLASLADELRQSVSTFKLTEDDEHEISATIHDRKLEDLLQEHAAGMV